MAFQYKLRCSATTVAGTRSTVQRPTVVILAIFTLISVAMCGCVMVVTTPITRQSTDLSQKSQNTDTLHQTKPCRKAIGYRGEAPVVTNSSLDLESLPERSGRDKRLSPKKEWISNHNTNQSW